MNTAAKVDKQHPLEGTVPADVPMITELRSIDQHTRSQETVVGKMILVSARDEVKRTEHCMKMSRRKTLKSILGEMDSENGRFESVRRHKTTGDGRGCRVRCQGFTISIHVKAPQQGSQVSQERQQSEQFIFKPVAHAARTKMTDIFQPATSKTTDPGVSSDMMAKPQSVVKLRRFGALLNGVV